ncbi:ATP-binding protein [Eubacteriales bacterium OttesenSCG-928-G02]|nr:ATP-binding protein [Eubacteriales bacterium OttesenSCG-928-G02]
MKELSLNILDIVQNSITAKATLIEIILEETEAALDITIIDDGCGMTKEMVEKVTNPFCTSRTTRKVGLGIPFFMLAAEQTGGHLELESKTIADNPNDHGTRISASFNKNHLDFTPLGDIISTITTIINGCGDIDINFTHKLNESEVHLSTIELKQVLGDDISLTNIEVIIWIKEYLQDQYNNI